MYLHVSLYKSCITDFVLSSRPSRPAGGRGDSQPDLQHHHSDLEASDVRRRRKDHGLRPGEAAEGRGQVGEVQ